MYKNGQILNEKEQIEFAIWTAENGNKLSSKSNGDKTFTVYEIPEPTNEEIQIRVRGIRNQMLTESDKYMISDFPMTDEERYQMKLYRQYLRDYTKQNDWWKELPVGFADWRADVKKVDEILTESTKTEPEAEEAEPEK